MNRGGVRIEDRVIASVVSAASFAPLEGAFDDEARDDEHILRFPRFFRRKLFGKKNLRPGFNAFERFGQLGFVAHDAAFALHDALERIANVADVPSEDAVAEGTDVRSQEVRPLGANNSLQAEGAETTVGTMASTGFEGVMEGDSQLRLGAMLASETIDDLSSEDASLVFDGAVAAQGWSAEQGVAVSTDLVNAFSNAYIEGAATIYQIKDDTKTSKLRVVKVANKDAARPGELVEFTLRFENIGDELIGNVTILDSLSPRLRYVDGTAQSSVSADLVASLNEQGALVLRWEITDPLKPKEFGVVRFICKVQ